MQFPLLSTTFLSLGPSPARIITALGLVMGLTFQKTTGHSEKGRNPGKVWILLGRRSVVSCATRVAAIALLSPVCGDGVESSGVDLLRKPHPKVAFI